MARGIFFSPFGLLNVLVPMAFCVVSAAFVIAAGPRYRRTAVCLSLAVIFIGIPLIVLIKYLDGKTWKSIPCALVIEDGRRFVLAERKPLEYRFWPGSEMELQLKVRSGDLTETLLGSDHMIGGQEHYALYEVTGRRNGSLFSGYGIDPSHSLETRSYLPQVIKAGDIKLDPHYLETRSNWPPVFKAGDIKLDPHYTDIFVLIDRETIKSHHRDEIPRGWRNNFTLTEASVKLLGVISKRAYHKREECVVFSRSEIEQQLSHPAR